MTTRRNFLLGAAAMTASAAIPEAAFAQRHLLLGLQLYTVRADLAKDYEGTLKQVKAAGVRQLQANLTMSGKTSQQQRKLYDDMGFVWDSIHAGGDQLRKTPEATIDEAKAAGIKNITCSFPLYPEDRAVIMKGYMPGGNTLYVFSVDGAGIGMGTSQLVSHAEAAAPVSVPPAAAHN